MRRTVVFLKGLMLPAVAIYAACGLGQCVNQTTMLPLRPMEAAHRSRDFVRYRYKLSDADRLLIRSHEDTATSIGPYDLGFVITRGDITMKRLELRSLPELQKAGADYWQSFTTMAITRACGSQGPLYLVTMKYMGDELSPALVFVVIPSPERYDVSALPLFSGGAVDVSRADPSHLTIWHNLNEGRCNACETPYLITEYEIKAGKPVPVRSYRTKRLYSSGQFGQSRIRFVP
jgi:hypothetical protein